LTDINVYAIFIWEIDFREECKGEEMKKDLVYYPISIKGERVWRTYVGGKKLDELEGLAQAEDTHKPELWILSTVEAKNAGRETIKEGKCYLKEDNSLSLSDLIQSYPEETLGKVHSKTYHGKMGVLVKVIDSKERLTIQVHPTKEKARQYFDSDYGKTECWHIIDTRREGPNPCIYLGFKENVTKESFNQLFEEQDLDGMLDMLHCIPVKKGDTYIIPGGIPHAIGAGCALVEIQEPTDYTLRVEQTTPSGFKIDKVACHQGIGVEAMLDCFNFRGMNIEEVMDLCKLKGKEVLVSYEDTPYFQMEKITVDEETVFLAEESFYGLFVLSGSGEYEVFENQEAMTQALKTEKIQKLDQFFLATTCKPFKIKAIGGPLEIIKFKGPKC
jgi:mannose-6-phosphate isomerase